MLTTLSWKHFGFASFPQAWTQSPSVCNSWYEGFQYCLSEGPSLSHSVPLFSKPGKIQWYINRNTFESLKFYFKCQTSSFLKHLIFSLPNSLFNFFPAGLQGLRKYLVFSIIRPVTAPSWMALKYSSIQDWFYVTYKHDHMYVVVL